MPFMAHIPPFAFRVPDGTIAMAVRLHGTKFMTAVIGVADLAPWLSALEAGIKMDVADRTDRRTHTQVCELLRQDMERGDDGDMTACVTAAFWLALNHPHASATMRMQVAASMQTQNRAQITITSDHRQLWSFVVSECPVMPDAIMAATPVEPTVCLTFPERPADLPGRSSQGH